MSEETAFSKDELLTKHDHILKEYNKYAEMGLNLDMSRGKPNTNQLDISNGLLDGLKSYIAENDVDVRNYSNYGLLSGLPETRRLFSELLDIPSEKIIIGGNSALNLIYDSFSRLFIFGTHGSTPWSKLPKIKFLCPVPGYDRHFAICEEFGVEMISVPLNDDGPDMDMVEELAANDETVKGIICVPLYSNPGGTKYSEEVTERLAKMKTAAADFRIFWDNAYGVHHIYKENRLPDILTMAEKYGNEDRVYYFFSTSKITFPGSGIALVASSLNNIKEIRKRMHVQTIGHNKIIQLEIVNYFKTADGIKEHMKKHAEILKPKFDMVFNMLEKEFKDSDLCHWTKPEGGYFIVLYTLKGCAKKVVELAKNAGVILTDAGATHPYKNNPDDDCIRLAPTYPDIDELKTAMHIISVCIKLAGIEKLIKGDE